MSWPTPSLPPGHHMTIPWQSKLWFPEFADRTSCGDVTSCLNSHWLFRHPPVEHRPDITVMVGWALKINYLSILWSKVLTMNISGQLSLSFILLSGWGQRREINCTSRTTSLAGKERVKLSKRSHSQSLHKFQKWPNSVKSTQHSTWSQHTIDYFTLQVSKFQGCL